MKSLLLFLYINRLCSRTSTAKGKAWLEQNWYRTRNTRFVTITIGEEEGECCILVFFCVWRLLQDLHTMLELKVMPTERVVASYYHDLLEYQKTTFASRGSLSVVVGYARGRKQVDFTCGSPKGRTGHIQDLTWGTCT